MNSPREGGQPKGTMPLFRDRRILKETKGTKLQEK